VAFVYSEACVGRKTIFSYNSITECSYAKETRRYKVPMAVTMREPFCNFKITLRAVVTIICSLRVSGDNQSCK